jgi:hypothetical protein
MDHTTTPPPATKPDTTPQAQTGSSVTTTPPPAKPGASKTSKAASGKSAAKSSASGELPPLINPDWAAAIIKNEDIIGKTAELAVGVLTTAIEKQVKKATTPEKLEKIVWSAITEARRRARG